MPYQQTEKPKFEDIEILGTVELGQKKRILITEMAVINTTTGNRYNMIKISEQFYGSFNKDEPDEWRFTRKFYSMPVRVVGPLADILNKWLKQDAAEAESQMEPQTDTEPPSLFKQNKKITFKKPSFL